MDASKFTFHNPVCVHFGAGALAELPRVLAGRSAVLVTFPEARSLGLVSQVRDLLGSSLAGVLDRIEPNPDVAWLSETYERFWMEHAGWDAVLAVGGGSAIDTAKVLSVATPGRRFDELLRVIKGEARAGSAKALVAVPTTAGTGSEVTPWATVWDRANGRKHSLHLPQTWPEAAIVDPGTMTSLPPAVTLQSGLDALSHALESIWNVNGNPVSDTLAADAARSVMRTLPALMATPNDGALRAGMALAALKAGLAFSNTRTALAHSVSYEMTLRCGLPHGIACSFTLPLIMEMAIGVDCGRDQALSAAFDCGLRDAPRRLRAFLEELGVATDFAAYGVPPEEAAAMMRRGLEGARGRNFIGEGAM